MNDAQTAYYAYAESVPVGQWIPWSQLVDEERQRWQTVVNAIARKVRNDAVPEHTRVILSP